MSNLSYPKPRNFPVRQLFDPPIAASQQPEINQLEDIDWEFLEKQVEQDIETNSPYQGEFF